MPETCIECGRLLQAYADSIKTHLDAVHRSHSAAVRENRTQLAESERLENLALRERHNRRNALMEHEVGHLIQDLKKRQ